MKDERNVLDELNKGACMGMDAIKDILDKVEDENLHKVLDDQYNSYKDISRRINEIYPDYSDKEPHETSTMNKVMTWYGIEMKTLTDHTTSKLAEILMQGTNMGIIEGRRLLNQKSTDEKINSLVEEYVNMQEKYVETLKYYI